MKVRMSEQKTVVPRAKIVNIRLGSSISILIITTKMICYIPI